MMEILAVRRSKAESVSQYTSESQLYFHLHSLCGNEKM